MIKNCHNRRVGVRETFLSGEKCLRAVSDVLLSPGILAAPGLTEKGEELYKKRETLFPQESAPAGSA